MAIDKEKKRMRQLRSGLRRLWLYYGQNRRDTITALGTTPACALCKQHFKRAELAIDHIEPAGSLKTWADFLGFVKRLFFNPCQALCEQCHAAKTKRENAERRKAK